MFEFISKLVFLLQFLTMIQDRYVLAKKDKDDLCKTGKNQSPIDIVTK